FGVPMILSYTATFLERLRFYTDISGVAVDFPVTTSAEFRAAQAMFNQSPRPPTIAIGRAVNKPTTSILLSAANPTANITHTYQLIVGGKGFAETTLSFTSDATPTDAEYATLAVAALNGVAGKNYTASGAASPIGISGNAPGDWFYVMPVNPAT